MSVTAISLCVTIVTLAVVIWLSARKVCRTIEAAASSLSDVMSRKSTNDVVVIDRTETGGRVEKTPILGGDATQELLELHKNRYESGGWKVDAKTDDSVDLQDDASEMTDALREIRR